MKVFSNPVGSGNLWFDNLTTAQGTPVAYDPQARAFVPMPPFCVNRDISSHIDKPFAEVPPLQRRQWILQVLTLALPAEP